MPAWRPSSRGAARRATGRRGRGRGGRGRRRRVDGAGMTATVERPGRSAAPSVVQEIAARRQADIDRELAGEPPDRGRHPRRRATGPDPRAVPRPRPPPHRGDQAGVAIGRPHRRRRRGHRRPRPRLPGRRRRRDLGPLRAALVRRVGRRPARGPRGGLDPGPRQGVRRRCAPARAAAARGRGRGAAARGPAPGQGLRAARRAGAVARARAARGGARRARARLAVDTDARLIGINNRDLRTLAVDPDRAGRLRELVPDDRLVIAESGVRGRRRRPLAGAGVRRRARRRGAGAERRSRRDRPRLRGGRGRPDRSGQRRAPAAREDLRDRRRGQRHRRDLRRGRRHRAQPRPGHAAGAVAR